MKKYCLEIYEPDTKLDVMKSFQSDTPFLAILKGDILNTSFLDKTGPERLIKVTEIQHILWDHEDGKGIKHKICIYTQKA